MSTLAIPQNFSQWQHCITVECDIPLTSDFIASRITALQNKDNEHTRQFIKCYGEGHHAQVLGWFEQARAGQP